MGLFWLVIGIFIGGSIGIILLSAACLAKHADSMILETLPPHFADAVANGGTAPTNT